MTRARIRLAGLAVLLAATWGASAAPAADTTGWGAEVRLTEAGTISETGLNHGALALTPAGLVAAWAEQDGPNQNFQIHTRTRTSAGVWGAAELAVAFDSSYAGVTLGAKFPALASLPGDTLLLVWHDYRIDGINNLELYTKTRAPGGGWSDSTGEIRLTTTFHPETGGDNSYMPNLTVDPGGTAHVAWYDFRYDGNNAEILYKNRAGGAWDTTPGDASDANVSLNAGDSNFPALAAAPDGSLHLAWRDNTGGTFTIRYRRRSPGGTWTDAATLSPPGASADGVTLAVATDGTLVAVWADTRTGSKAIYGRERDPAGTWGAPRRISPDGAGAEEPAVTVGPDDMVAVAWQDARVSVFNREIFLQCAPLGAAWDSTGTSDMQVSDGTAKSSRPTLLAPAAGTLYVLWQDARHGPAEIYFRARETDVTAVSPQPVTALLRAVPNPFHGGVSFAQVPGDVLRLDVLDVRGRRLATLPVHGGGAAWDGRTAGGLRVPRGVYFVTGRGSAGGRAAIRVVRTR